MANDGGSGDDAAGQPDEASQPEGGAADDGSLLETGDSGQLLMEAEFEKQQPKLPGLMTPYELQLTHQKLLAASGRFGPPGAPSTAEVRFMTRVESRMDAHVASAEAASQARLRHAMSARAECAASFQQALVLLTLSGRERERSLAQRLACVSASMLAAAVALLVVASLVSEGSHGATAWEGSNGTGWTAVPAEVSAAVARNRELMKLSDLAALFAAAAVVSFRIGREVLDCKLCQTTVVRVLEHRAPRSAWRLPFAAVSAVRQFAICPACATSVPLLALTAGSDSKTVCLNAMCVVFALTISAEAFDNALPERLRTSVEEAREAKARPSTEELWLCDVTKCLHQIAYFAAMVLPVLFAEATTQPTVVAHLAPLVVSFICGLLEGLASESTMGGRARGVGAALCRWALGLGAYWGAAMLLGEAQG